jgi:hypothetical protein
MVPMHPASASALIVVDRAWHRANDKLTVARPTIRVGPSGASQAGFLMTSRLPGARTQSTRHPRLSIRQA